MTFFCLLHYRLFCKIENENDKVNVDSDLMDIIHYIIENGKYIGSCEKLAVGAGVTNCNGKHIRSLLDKHKNILEMYFIRYLTTSSIHQLLPVYQSSH